MVAEAAAVEHPPASLEPAPEHVVDVVAGDVVQAGQDRAAHVQVAAEDERRALRPVERGGPRALAVGHGSRGRRVVRVHVDDPGPVREPDPVHAPALGPAPQERRAVLADRPAHEDRVRAAAVGAQEIGVAHADRPAQRQPEVARGEHMALLRCGEARERLRPPRRDLLEQRDVPVPARQRDGEGAEQRAARGRDGAAVVEVPGEHAHRRADRTLSRLPEHLVTGAELDPAALSALLDRAQELKADPLASRALAGRSVALVFEQPSTRTRVSFEAGIAELGGHALVLRPDEMQLTRGESVRDTALVLSRHVAAIGLRTGSDERIEELARHADVPVVNMLSPRHHPCQALADLLTMREAFGTDLSGRVVAYVGDGNNVARSLALVGALAGVEVRVAAPAGLQLEDGLGAHLTDDPDEAVAGADVVYTDVWVSMSDHPDEAAQRRERLAPYRLDDALLDRAAPHAFALHCLPAHPGEEISEAVLYGERQRIWDQAENRRHAQKALLELLVSSA
jgi:ornithine carbamoyltransferase